jgi:hypothetical protein
MAATDVDRDGGLAEHHVAGCRGRLVVADVVDVAVAELAAVVVAPTADPPAFDQGTGVEAPGLDVEQGRQRAVVVAAVAFEVVTIVALFGR